VDSNYTELSQLSTNCWDLTGLHICRFGAGKVPVLQYLDITGEVGENRRLKGHMLVVEDVDAILPVGGALGKLEE
jgi:hypothetical protein